MKAVQVHEFGPPGVLQLADLPAPQAGPGQVRVRVRAAGVLPFDLRVRSGWSPPGQALALPVVLGNEFAGVVDAVGPEVNDIARGDHVLGFDVLGCYAEQVVVGADQVAPRPHNMPWEVAGGFSANGQGAHTALQAIGVRPGDTVLILGAAGGLGAFAVQLARAWGAATVIGTASQPNHDYLRRLGAIPVSYGDGLVERVRAVAPGGVDAALDAAGPDALRAAVELVEDPARVTTMVSYELAAQLGLPQRFGQRSAARLAELCGLYAAHQIVVHLRRIYPLQQAEDAHRDLGRGHGRGKVVLSVGEDIGR